MVLWFVFKADMIFINTQFLQSPLTAILVFNSIVTMVTLIVHSPRPIFTYSGSSHSQNASH